KHQCSGLGWLPEETDFSEGGTHSCLGDSQPNFFSRNCFAANQPAISNTGSACNLTPAAVLPGIDRKSLDTLAQWQVFTNADHIEGHRTTKIQHEFRSGDAVVAGPVGIAAAIDQVLRRKELMTLTACVAGADSGALSQIVGKGSVKQATKLAQRLAI